ncbi:hypothetical protein FN846DRAFT_890186 [Sphaerosporella brunnea]|uniref:Secreted protein n=1 Tax=Sphaerosporella brunnea TaxID=1250544 RepID=A0A5J5EWX1_9PEZI|nr:hypothetical protein FN846DRAFT_890186 [Sphaerosporella brunnea]
MASLLACFAVASCCCRLRSLAGSISIAYLAAAGAPVNQLSRSATIKLSGLPGSLLGRELVAWEVEIGSSVLIHPKLRDLLLLRFASNSLCTAPFHSIGFGGRRETLTNGGRPFKRPFQHPQLVTSFMPAHAFGLAASCTTKR